MTQESTPTLEPCPKCGSEATMQEAHWRDGTLRGEAPFCKNCGLSMPRYWPQRQDSAIAAWNRRTPPVSQSDEVDAEFVAALKAGEHLTSQSEALAEERAVMVCPQCEGEGGYPDGLDEAACHTECTRCGGNGWIVNLAALRAEPPADAAELVGRLKETDWGPNVADTLTRRDNARREAADALASLSRRVAELEAENARKDDMLRLAARWFEQYALDHEIKARQAPDSYEQANRMDKARRNTERANEIRAAIGASDA